MVSSTLEATSNDKKKHKYHANKKKKIVSKGLHMVRSTLEATSNNEKKYKHYTNKSQKIKLSKKDCTWSAVLSRQPLVVVDEQGQHL